MEPQPPADNRNQELAWHVYASPVLETLFSMQCLLTDWYDEPWAQEARRRLGTDYLAELDRVLGPFRDGTDIFEVAVATERHNDVEAFVDYLRNVDTEEFVYYVFGQIVPHGKTVADLNPAELRSLFDNYGEYAHYLENMTRFTEEGDGNSWTSVSSELKHNVAELIEYFWHSYFRDQIANLKLRWNMSVAKNEAYAEQHGPIELLALETEQRKLPPMVPHDVPLERIDFVPIVHLPTATRKYVGNGTITCLYKADRTEERIEELRKSERDAIRIAKALGDKTRMSIMKLVFQHAHVLNGQNIAEMTGLAKSVVSKHLRQLIDAGLVIERTKDRRNNIYAVNTDAIRRISSQLLEVLKG